MSLGSKLLTASPFVTGVSAYPLVVVTKNELARKAELPPPPPTPKPVEVPKPVNSEVAQIKETLEQLVREGYSDCTQVNGYKRPGVPGYLYVCVFTRADKTLTPAFFYFNRKDTTRREPKDRKVTYISTKMFNNRYMELADKSIVKFERGMYPFWMSKMDGELRPEQDCQIEKKDGGHKLTCKGHAMNQNERS